jgi:hypothetical protein
LSIFGDYWRDLYLFIVIVYYHYSTQRERIKVHY